ncbi:hypothetical protein [Parabacteroides distasonis]|uniref:hypothetical protein n=2 Tax=Parabacteroides distasonis TaxID=823 RepID=UPI00321B5570
MRNSIVLSLFNMLNREGISYSVLRNFEALPENCGNSDLDLFVASSDLTRFYRVMTEVARQTNSHLVSYTSDTLSPKICYLNTKEGIQIDVFKGEICCKVCSMIPEEDIVKHTIDYNGIKVLEPRFGELVAFLKEVLNNGECADKYIAPLEANKNILTEQFISEHLSYFSHEFCRELSLTIANNQYTKGFSYIHSVGLNVLKKKVKRANGILSKLDRLFHQPGYTIAVLGTDGSGKSFIINSITPILNEAFHKGVRYEHMRPNHLPSIAVLTGRKKKTETVTVCSNPHGSNPSGVLGSLMRLTYYWIDYTYGYLRKVFLDKAFKTHLWIFDRYYYDYYIDQRRARLHLPNWTIKLYGIFVPSPNLILCLGGDPEKIYARKPETSLEEVKRQTMILRKFCDRHKKAVWIDTTMKPEESIEAAIAAILDMMSKRFAKTKLK